MEIAMPTRVNVSRSTKGQWTPDATIKITSTGEIGEGETVEGHLNRQREVAGSKLNLAIANLEHSYPCNKVIA